MSPFFQILILRRGHVHYDISGPSGPPKPKPPATPCSALSLIGKIRRFLKRTCILPMWKSLTDGKHEGVPQAFLQQVMGTMYCSQLDTGQSGVLNLNPRMAWCRFSRMLEGGHNGGKGWSNCSQVPSRRLRREAARWGAGKFRETGFGHWGWVLW